MFFEKLEGRYCEPSAYPQCSDHPPRVVNPYLYHDGSHG